MPNGRPGDHPYTDVVKHDLEAFTEPVRRYLREIHEYGDPGAKDRAFSLLPWDADVPASELERIERELRALYETVERADSYPGRSPLAAVVDHDASVYDETVRSLVREIHDALGETVDNTPRGRKKLSALLWRHGWEPDDLDALASDLREFRDDHWIWDH